MTNAATKPMKIAFQGEHGREFPPCHRRSLSRRRTAGLPHLRGRARRNQLGRSRSRHDPDRKFGGGPGRRYPPSAAAVRPVHRRRVVRADPPSVDGTARRQTRRHQDRREPCPCARTMPAHHPQARHQADRVGRHRRQRAHRRRTRRQELRLDRLKARRRHLRPRHPGRECRGRDPQHHPIRGAGTRRKLGQTGTRDRWSPASCSGCATCRPRCTRRWAVSPPTAST